MTYFAKGIATTQLKRDKKAVLLESIEAGRCAPSHGMTKEEAIALLRQDIADYEAILMRLQDHQKTAPGCS